jgi:hypothetical protein
MLQKTLNKTYVPQGTKQVRHDACRKCGSLAVGPAGLCWGCEDEKMARWERGYEYRYLRPLEA